MPVDAGTLRELMAAGLAGDALVAAVERIDGYRRVAQRTGAAERQRRRRAATSHGVTRDSDVEAPKKTRRELTAWPAHFLPNLTVGTDKGWTLTRAGKEAQRFHDYCLANDKRYRDWPAAWRNWVGSPYQEKANGNETLAERGDRLEAEAKRLESEGEPFESVGSNRAG